MGYSTQQVPTVTRLTRQVFKLAGKLLYLLNYLAGPIGLHLKGLGFVVAICFELGSHYVVLAHTPHIHINHIPPTHIMLHLQ